MSLLIYSGLLYLLGVAIILAIKPALMFSEDGNWKEFGIGRSKERYTWMPFWLFAILWAILSYTIVLVLVGENTNTQNEYNETSYRSQSKKRSKQESVQEQIDDIESMDEPVNISKPTKKGYYILNNNAGKGSPQYIYLGPHAPNLHYEEE